MIFVILFVSCKSDDSSFDADLLPGYWLGGGVKLDINAFRPFNHFLEIDSEKCVRAFSVGWRDTFKPIEIAKDSIHFPYRKYPLNSVAMVGDELAMGEFYPFYYKKVQPVMIPKDSIEMKAELIGGQWISGDEMLEFREDGLIVFNKRLKTKEKICWDILDNNGIKFLQRLGNFKECETPYFPLELIHYFSNDTLKIETWRNSSFQTLTYKRIAQSTEEYSVPEFQVCDPYLYENNRSDWYYFKYPSFDGGLYRLKQIFDERYTPIKFGKNNGLVKLKFVINCEGKVGRLQIEEMDIDFRERSLNPQIRNQIVDIFNGAGDWIPGERRNETVDAFKFLIFRIKDGEIDEIYP
ncbi:hypothetical protein GCM10007940_37670 [Portibacter lacus]|uniref:Uncharacterized protein n=1 Tax=Portibacter lacus TaxID=1099794 RepID=A0AA37WEV2_9BACT|nr:hypothetical protein GCM10007940_37670 [Portibacter lacus]